MRNCDFRELKWLKLTYGIAVISESNFIKGKIKKSRNRPGVAQRVPGVSSSQISMTFGT
jgi:hypothetical protein